jgi:hypothetical protein
MKNKAREAATTLLQSMSFKGLSDEQALLASLVSQNPATDLQVRSRARSLLLLHDGATVAEVAQATGTSRRRIFNLILRFHAGGLCHALLGIHASQERRIWLSLSPSSPPRVHLKFRGSHSKPLIDNTSVAANRK